LRCPQFFPPPQTVLLFLDLLFFTFQVNLDFCFCCPLLSPPGFPPPSSLPPPPKVPVVLVLLGQPGPPPTLGFSKKRPVFFASSPPEVRPSPLFFPNTNFIFISPPLVTRSLEVFLLFSLFHIYPVFFVPLRDGFPFFSGFVLSFHVPPCLLLGSGAGDDRVFFCR